MTYRMLDLFCGAGGAAVGYARAGFEVVGVDIADQPRYPFEFHRADAMDVLCNLGMATMFDAIHASPPCQGYSHTRTMNNEAAARYPKLIASARSALRQLGLPYVLENVEGARGDMIAPVTLCGSQFDACRAIWPPHGTVGLRRHRLFEANFPLVSPGPHDHSLRSVRVYGGGGDSKNGELAGPGLFRAARQVMGIDWMNRAELNESIPPAYTEFIGRQLIAHLETTSNARQAA